MNWTEKEVSFHHSDKQDVSETAEILQQQVS